MTVDEISILHFNDLYHISDATLVSRFATVLGDPSHVVDDVRLGPNQLRVFSGDVFSPSLEASLLRGEHMTGLLNNLRIDVACYGNHDFDFGETRLAELSERNSFPWTLSNAIRSPQSNGHHPKLLAKAQKFVIRECAGYRIGFFGLAGTDWPSNCLHLPACIILDPANVACELAKHLRIEERCDLVVAITHMRLGEDMKVSHATTTGNTKVDLILGGHDHYVVRKTQYDTDNNPGRVEPFHQNDCKFESGRGGKIKVVKSGTDWRGLSIVRLFLRKEPGEVASVADVQIKQIRDLGEMPNYNQIPMCPTALHILATTQTKINGLTEQPLWHTEVPLDGRTQIIRSEETNLGNMLADATRAYYSSDIAIINSGAIRCDRIIQQRSGEPLRVRDAVDISPFGNPLVVKRISGQQLRAALENSVCDAHTDGRFLQVSGMRFTFDWRRDEGFRVLDAGPVTKLGKLEEFQNDKFYTVAMVEFIASGFDGYSSFINTETVVDIESAITDTNLLLEILQAEVKEEKAMRQSTDYKGGITRAKTAIIHKIHEFDGLPVVKPDEDTRITALGRNALPMS